MASSFMKLHVLLIGGLYIVGAFASASDAKELTFEADVRRILKAHCFQCHGELGEKKGGLDLRLRRLMIAGGDSGPSIVPKQIDKSYLVERIRSGEMPPGADKQLSKQDIGTIETWIATGAKTARAEPKNADEAPQFTEEERNWWSFQTIVRPAVPQVAAEDRDFIRSPIDAFALSRLKRLQADISVSDVGVNFHFAKPASRAVLIRRANFDLLGLPPTPPETSAFELAQADDGWEWLVERLLASPHYGERWGRHWLDVAGYADSEGYTDEDRVREHAYRFRDYVIQSFNENKPFDQFVIEQLAGDELTTPAQRLALDPIAIEKLTATGFLRMAPDGTASSGIDRNLARNQVMADTLQIVGTSLLGMTVNCAQCHDHRYDPIPTADYYRLRAIFEPALNWKNWQTPAGRQVSLYTDADKTEQTRIEADAKKVEAERQSHADRYISMTLEQELLLIGSELRDAVKTAFRTVNKDRTAEQTKLLTDHPSIKNIRTSSLYLYERRRAARIKDLETKQAEIRTRLFSDESAFEIIDLDEATRQQVVAARLADAAKRTPEQKTLFQKHAHVLIANDVTKQLTTVAAKEIELYDTAVQQIRENEIRKHLQELLDKVAAVRSKIPPEHFVRALVEPAKDPPATFVFFRGDHDQPKATVEPASLSVLPVNGEIPSKSAKHPTSGRRLRFAQHLTDGQHPLVARVIVNRIWLHHFGRGLVNSPGDFGVLGERPTHPLLLDWLAAEFVDSGWNVKHIHRLIMHSTLYQQSSTTGDEVLLNADPENRYYGRAAMRRLEAEVLRDAILSVSDRLNSKLYGAPVPVMEDSVGQIVIGKENLDGERKPTKPIPLWGEEYRRSVYIQVRRSRPLAVLDTFDSPRMTPNCANRSTSNVAPQSLLMMNSDFALQYSRKFADRLIDSNKELAPQVSAGWQLAFGHAASSEEIAASVGFVNRQIEVIRATDSKAKPAEIHRKALATFCQALLSSNRFIYVE